jgi:peptide chain release factor 3
MSQHQYWQCFLVLSMAIIAVEVTQCSAFLGPQQQQQCSKQCWASGSIPVTSRSIHTAFVGVTDTTTDHVRADSNVEDEKEGASHSGSMAISSTDDDEQISFRVPQLEINRRRNLAIISHPDSGKTTMTEKLLLYGGAIQQAGAVRHKAEQRSTTSDFMAMEQERGISISSTVLNFDYNGFGIRLLDTPGHNDFSEDTYRALAAADNALMLLDAAKGLEPQTRKLFAVCRLRGLPLFTFCNKMDRPALSPYQIMDQIEAEFSLPTHPIFWPIGDGDRFKGVLDRTTNTVLLYTKAEKRGQKASVESVPLSDVERLTTCINDAELLQKLLEDAELLNELVEPLDLDAVRAGQVTPLFFGSAMTNFGVEQFLQTFCAMGTRPVGRPSVGVPIGTAVSTAATTSLDDVDDNINNNKDDDDASTTNLVPPEHDEFTGFVFKTQANLDPKHRDRLAYVRVVSGVYRKGIKVGHSRSKPSKRYNLAQAQALFGSDRTAIDVAYPGDVIGINNPGNFAIGDTLYTGPTRVCFPGIPSFSPEKFAYIRAPNPSDYKAFRKGLDQLLDEGAVQALRQRNDDGGGPLMLAAVGQLQFEVVQARLKQEYNVDSILEPLGYSLARWANAGWEAVDKADKDGKLFGILIVQDRWQRPVLLFRNDWKASSVEEEEKYLQLMPWSQPPAYTD